MLSIDHVFLPVGLILSVNHELGNVLDPLDILMRQTDTFSVLTPSDYTWFISAPYAYIYIATLFG